MVYDAYKYYQNAVFRKHSANLPVGDRSALWLTDFETPAGIKTDPILNNYLIQTMENNARSGVRCVQAEKSFIFIFPCVVRTEKTFVVFGVLKQRTDYISRSSKTGVPNEPLFKNNRSSPFLSLAGIPSQQAFRLLV